MVNKMKNKKNIFLRIITISILLALSACNMPVSADAATAEETPLAVAQAHNLATVNPNPSKTATPFQPLGPTATYTITPTPTITSTPTVTPITFTPTPTVWNSNLTKPEGQVNIMVLGNDYRPSSGYRTDVMMLVSINPDPGIVNVVSFPRDLYVEIPGRGMNRLNVAQPLGGFELLASTLELNFGIRPDAYIMTNFNGFVSIINTLGGVDVTASQNLYDTCDLPAAVNGYCSAGPGVVHMDGATALWYVRSRYTSNDLDRNRRQQEVMYAIFKKLLSLNAVTRAPELYNTFRGSVETDLGLDELLPLLTIIPKISDSNNINRYSIGAGQTTSYITPGGAMVLLPNEQAIQAILAEAIYLQ